MKTDPKVLKAIRIAKKAMDRSTSPMLSSAAVCIQDAKHLAERGMNSYAIEKALKSVAYSVGVFSNDYKKVKSLLAVNS